MSQAKNVDKATIRLFWQAGLRNKRLLLLGLMYPLGGIFLAMITPFFIGKTLAELAIPDGNPDRYIPYFLGSALLGWIFNRIGFAKLLQHQARTMSYLQSLSLHTLLKRSVGFHNNNVGGKLVSDAIDLPTAYSQLANAVLVSLLPLSVILLVGATIIYFESWAIGLLITAMTIYAVGSGIYSSRRRAPLRIQRLKATKAVTSHLADVILNVQTVKTFARENREMTQHQRLNHTLRDQRLQDWSSAAYDGNTRIAILLLLQLAFILLTIRLVRDNPALLGIGIFAFSFTITLSLRLFEFNVMIRQIEDALLGASPMTEIILEEPEILDHAKAKPLRAKKGEIALQEVTFHYQDSATNQTIFSKLNLVVAPGEKIGLVGPSGGGKSTLTRLLLRFEDIDNGQITIDGQNIAEVTQESLRDTIAYVPQEPLLFHRSVLENIAYGKDNASQKDIIKASRSAHADIFIDTLPDGYDTIVGERGVKLSGGQRQRIAI
ncbi:MAG: ABC transporter ATP-binding protein, partial [Patescibacteria group bacterium]